MRQAPSEQDRWFIHMYLQLLDRKQSRLQSEIKLVRENSPIVEYIHREIELNC